MRGKVKFFNEGKGFGFITGDDGNDYFVHVTGIAQGTTVTEGDEVSFEVVSGDRGKRAEKVTVGGSSTEKENVGDSD